MKRFKGFFKFLKVWSDEFNSETLAGIPVVVGGTAMILVTVGIWVIWLSDKDLTLALSLKLLILPAGLTSLGMAIFYFKEYRGRDD